MELVPRHVRPVPSQLGLYFKVGYNDHIDIGRSLASNPRWLSGIVLDPTLEDRHEEIRIQAAKCRLEIVLDTFAMELATLNGWTKTRSSLAWSGGQRNDPSDFTPTWISQFAGHLAHHVVSRGYTAVLAPTHFLDGPSSPWIDIDAALTLALRESLDREVGCEISIHYPLATSSGHIANQMARSRLLTKLRSLPIESLWMRIHPFGTTSSGPIALRRYVEVCRDFHQLNVPMVAERTGTVGLSLLAIGAVGGIESGVTTGESFDFGRLRRPRPRDGHGFRPSPRVYIGPLATFLPRDRARSLFESGRMKARLACNDTECCRRGATDMIARPGHHFLFQRMAEVQTLSQTPHHLRANQFLEEVIRPASDLLVQVTRIDPSFEKTRRRIEDWRTTVSSIVKESGMSTMSAAPRGRRTRHLRGA